MSDAPSTRVSDELGHWLGGDQPKTLGNILELFGERSFALFFVLLMALPALPLPTAGATRVLGSGDDAGSAAARDRAPMPPAAVVGPVLDGTRIRTRYRNVCSRCDALSPLLVFVQLSSDFAGGLLLLSRGSERKRRADPSALLSTSYRGRRAVINQKRESRTTPLVAECAASIYRRRYTVRAASRSLRLARSALASCDPRTSPSGPSRSCS